MYEKTKEILLKYGIEVTDIELLEFILAVEQDKLNQLRESVVIHQIKHLKRGALISPLAIKEALEEFFNVLTIAKKDRKRTYVKARNYFCFIVKNELRISLQEIGTFIGGLDHSTVLHNLSSFDDMYYSDSVYRNDFIDFLDVLKSKGIICIQTIEKINSMRIILDKINVEIVRK